MIMTDNMHHVILNHSHETVKGQDSEPHENNVRNSKTLLVTKTEIKKVHLISISSSD